jgi:hypothetical protein
MACRLRDRVGLRLAGLLAAALVSAAAPARADAPLELRWIAPAGCPTADDVRAEFARLVRVPAAAAAPALSADARIEARGARFVLRLRTVRDGREGEREIEAESCASLARAAALVLVLAYGQGQEPADAPPDVEEHRAPPRPRAPTPRAPVETVPEAPPPPAPAPPPASPPTVVRVAPPPPPAAPERAVWSVAAEAGAGGSPIPGPGLRLGLGLDRAAGRFAATLRLEGWTPTEAPTAASGVGVRYEGLGASLGACVIPVRGARLALLACASGGLTALRGASTGAVSNRSATAPWTTIAPALRARVRLVGRVHLDARAELRVSLDRPRFAVLYLGDVSQVPLLIPAGILGISIDI